YSKQGGPTDTSAPYQQYLFNGGTQLSTPQPGKTKKQSGNNAYDPRLYEAPPQQAPKTQAPPAAPPSPGNGTGNGNGQANGNAPTSTGGGGAAPPGAAGQNPG